LDLSLILLKHVAGDVALSVPVQHCLFHKLRAEDAEVHLKDGESPTNEDKMKLAWASEMWITVELMKAVTAFGITFISLEIQVQIQRLSLQRMLLVLVRAFGPNIGGCCQLHLASYLSIFRALLSRPCEKSTPLLLTRCSPTEPGPHACSVAPVNDR
jgi:hypothetical protein